MINLNKKIYRIKQKHQRFSIPINFKGAVRAYYGINKDGFYRISFLSSKSPDIKGTTKNITIVQGNSSENNYWTCFDLKNDSLLSVFCTFGEDLISCVLEEKDEYVAVIKTKSAF